MRVHDAMALAGKAESSSAGRAASAIMHDSPDVRLVVFRLNQDDSVAMHTSTSTVVLSVVSGTGVITGPVGGEIEDVTVGEGSVVTYEPNELHGMRAPGGPFVVLATITPRPGGRTGAAA